MKKGLVMEGGAMRGMFTAGVTDVLMENKIEFDGAVGVSAGAVFGCNYKSQQVGRVIRYNTAYCRDPRYCSIRSLIKTGDMYGEDFCYRLMPQELDIFDTYTFEKNPMEFFVVCTDVNTGKAVYHKCLDGKADDLQWMRASASMPLASRIVEAGGYQLLDGGIADSIPFKFMENSGYDRNVLILTQPEGYIKKKNNLLPILRIALRKYPAVIKAIEIRHIMYNDTVQYIKEKEKNGEIFVVRPEAPLEIGAVEHDKNELVRVYNMGRASAEKNLKSLKNFLLIK